MGNAIAQRLIQRADAAYNFGRCNRRLARFESPEAGDEDDGLARKDEIFEDDVIGAEALLQRVERHDRLRGSRAVERMRGGAVGGHERFAELSALQQQLGQRGVDLVDAVEGTRPHVLPLHALALRLGEHDRRLKIGDGLAVAAEGAKHPRALEQGRRQKQRARLGSQIDGARERSQRALGIAPRVRDPLGDVEIRERVLARELVFDRRRRGLSLGDESRRVRGLAGARAQNRPAEKHFRARRRRAAALPDREVQQRHRRVAVAEEIFGVAGHVEPPVHVLALALFAGNPASRSTMHSMLRRDVRGSPRSRRCGRRRARR